MRILNVTKYFPPLNSAQALQTGKIADALAETGAEITVITGQTVSEETSFAFPVHPIFYREWPAPGLPKKIRRGLKEIFQVCSNSWVRRAVELAVRLHRERPFDLLFTQSTPFDGHIAGLLLKKTLGLPWCASFSDAFPIGIAPQPYRGGNYIPGLRFLQLRRLAEVLQKADGVQVSSITAARLMEKAVGLAIPDKVRQVPHIGDSAPHVTGGNGRLAHIGHLTRERSHEALVRGVCAAADRRPEFRGIDAIGPCSPVFKKRAEESGRPELFHFLPGVSFAESLAAMQRYTGLLVIEAEMEYSPFLPSKFSDAAESGKPILALTPAESAMTRYLRDYGGGIAVPFDADRIADAVGEIFTDGPRFSSEWLAELFTPKRIGSLYRSWFEELCQKHGASR